MKDFKSSCPVLVSGGGIGGLAAALALAKQGFRVQVFEQAKEIKEIGAGIQIGPNAFHAFDVLGIGEKIRNRSVYIDYLAMQDATNESVVAKIETGEAFRKRFKNPYAVIHRADIHRSLLEGAEETKSIEFHIDTRIAKIHQEESKVYAIDQNGKRWGGQALIGADGGKSSVRQQYISDPPRLTNHVVYRAVVNKADFPKNLQLNAATLWAGPKWHLIHYPLRGGQQYNLAITFQSAHQEQWGVTEGSKDEVQSYLNGASPKVRQLIDLPKSWKRWATADRDPVDTWIFGKVVLLGDAAHPTTQYMAQGACMAIEDAATLGEALRISNNNFDQAFSLYEKSRITRTARIVLSGREMGRLYHATGVDRLVRNSLWKSHSQERFYDALEWLYGWNVADSLVAN